MKSRVYFILNANARAVKIGVAEDVSARLSALQTGCVDALTLIAQMPGDEQFEADLHRHFAEYAIRGEWFRFEGRLAALIGLLPEMLSNAKVPRRRSERQRVRQLNRAAFEKHWEQLLGLIRDVVLSIGVDEFAKLVGSRRSDVVRAIYGGRGRHFALVWFVHLCQVATVEQMRPIFELMVEPLGVRLIVDEAAEENARRHLEALRESIRSHFGEVRAAEIEREFEAECAAEVARRHAAYEARWFLPDEASR